MLFIRVALVILTSCIKDPDSLLLMEDGALVHKEAVATHWRQAHCIKILKWPTNSPDLKSYRKQLEDCERPHLKLDSIKEYRGIGQNHSTDMERHKSRDEKCSCC